jgi:hypothetical protein
MRSIGKKDSGQRSNFPPDPADFFQAKELGGSVNEK